MKYHPDIDPDSPPDKFLEIKEAYFNLSLNKPEIKGTYTSGEKVFSRKYNRWFSKEEFDELLKKGAKLKQKKEESEKEEAIREFEELKQSWVYKWFPYVAVFGVVFSTLLLLDFHLNTANKSVKFIGKNKISVFDNGLMITSNPLFTLSEIITEDENDVRHVASVTGSYDGAFHQNSEIELMQTPIFKIDVGYKTNGMSLLDINKKKSFHYPLAIFSIFLISMTLLFKNPTPFYYVVLNTAVIAIPILSIIFIIGTFSG